MQYRPHGKSKKQSQKTLFSKYDAILNSMKNAYYRRIRRLILEQQKDKLK